MNTCGSCASWVQDEDSMALPVPYVPGDLGELQQKRNADVGRCEAAVFAPSVQYDDPVPLLMVQDGSDYRATLYTRRDFGCKAWS